MLPFSFKVVVEVFEDVNWIKHQEQFRTRVKGMLNEDFLMAVSQFFEKLDVRLVTIEQNQDNFESDWMKSAHDGGEMLQKTGPVQSYSGYETNHIFITASQWWNKKGKKCSGRRASLESKKVSSDVLNSLSSVNLKVKYSKLNFTNNYLFDSKSEEKFQKKLLTPITLKC